MSVRVRMAPSPTGNLHVGTARTALFNWLFARRQGGTFILRIEDTDQLRSTEESLRGVLESLRWLGMDWDEGPEVGGPFGPYFQMQRLVVYRRRAEELLRAGRAYPCYCTQDELEGRRKRAAAEGRPPRYDGRCRPPVTDPEWGSEIAARARRGQQPALRLAMPQHGQTAFQDTVVGRVGFPNAELDDWIILRSNGRPTYNFAVVVDDIAMQISHVIRGSDHIANTPRQVRVYEALGAGLPVFAHVPMVHGMDGKKLSKRHGPVSVLDYRRMGYLPQALRNFLALLGWSPGDDREILSRDEMIQAFDLERVHPAPAQFNVEKLDWMNGQYLRAMDVRTLAERIVPFMEEEGLEVSADELVGWAGLIQTRIRVLADAPGLIDFAFREIETPSPEALLPPRMQPADARRALPAALERLEALDGWHHQRLEAEMRALAEELALKAGSLFMLLRVAVTGKPVTPPLFESMELLGRERSLSRLRAALDRLSP